MWKFALHNPDDVGDDLVLECGQSNDVSFGSDGVDLTYLDTTDPRIRQWPSSGTYFGLGRPIGAVDPLAHHGPGPSGSVGHAMTFAREYLRRVPSNRGVLLVPCAHGSTGFSTSSLASPGAGYQPNVVGGGWDPSGGQGGINLYEFAIAQANAALAYNPKNRIVAIVWVQGEADGNFGMSQATYATYLDTLIDGFRSRITGAASVPFLIGQMVPERLAASPSYSTINLAHVDTPRRKTRTWFIYGPSGKYRTDDVTPPLHYNNEGQRALGLSLIAALPYARANVVGAAPAAPTAVTFTQSGTTVTVSWVRPLSRVTDYNVRYSTDGGATWTTLTRAQSIDNTATISGLTLGQSVQVEARTVNETGTSAWSTPGAFTLATIPAQVTGLAVTGIGSSFAPLSWTAVTGATGYLVEYKLHSASPWTSFGTVAATSGTVSGLTPQTQYDFRVTATNGANTGATPATPSVPSSTLTASTTATACLLTDVGVAAYYAHSLRRVNVSYAGSAIRVRRSSDNTEQDIGFAAGTNDLDTAALLTFVGAGNGFIKTWYDQSGNSRDYTQSTTASQARIVNAGVVDTSGGKPAAFFSGSNVYTDTTAANFTLTAGGASTGLVVSQWTGGTPSFPGVAGESGTTMFNNTITGLGSTSATLYAQLKNDASVSQLPGVLTTAMPTGAAVATCVVDSGNSIQGFYNSTALGVNSYTRSGVFTPTRRSLGSYNAAASWTGYISEVVVFASALAATPRDGGRVNQKGYYGTP